ncbi:MAG: glutaminyl-peptide cyclotransferase [Cellvibrionaceae bacterium]
MSLHYNIFIFIYLSCFSLFLHSANKHDSTPVFPVELLATENHNTRWFTQGLYHDNDDGFYISSGLYGKSALIYQTPKKTLRYSLPNHLFAEGLTVVNDELYLLTWKKGKLLVFDKTTLKKKREYNYQGEGWGLTHSPTAFIMSNGSNKLLFKDMDTFALQYDLTVQGLNNINELEYINGIIWANRWYDDFIYAIDSDTGCLLAKMNLRSLRQEAVQIDNKNISNGIAYDQNRKGLWVTGKYWSKRFLIKLPAVTKKSCSY